MSISRNLKMSYQRRMERGEFITCTAPYGYTLVDGKNLGIHEAEAKQVRWIFQQYLAGKSTHWIADQLNASGIPNPRDKGLWGKTAVNYILTNEKYIGNALCQKSYTANTFPFERKINHGEVDLYYVECTHPAIIARDTFEKVQTLMRKKAERTIVTPAQYPLSKKLFCGECGCVFSRKVNNTGYTAWVCRKHLHQASDCPTGRVAEQAIYAAFVRLYNKLKLHEGIILKPALSQLNDLNETLQRGNPAMLAVNQAIAEAAEQSHKISILQSRGLLDADACTAKFQEINAKLTRLRRERRRLMKNEDIEETLEALQGTVDVVHNGPERIESFDEPLFTELIEKIIIKSKACVFHLHGGVELTEALP